MNKSILSETVRYNLYDGIDNFGDYADFINEMMHYNDKDRVLIHINSGGGRVDVGQTIVHAIKNCKAHVTTVVEYPSYSMAAIIALSGDSLVMYPNTYLMFHNYSSGYGGKGGELTQMVVNNDNHSNELIKDLCSPFLTPTELRNLRNDRDIYIYADDPSLEKRKQRHFK